MSTALRIYKFEAPHLGSVTLTGRLELVELPFIGRPADVRFGCAACSSAYSDAGLFHKDASLGNVMIGLDGEGRLNDWDPFRGVNVDKSLEGPRTARGLLPIVTPVLTSVHRGLGSSCRPGCLRVLGQAHDNRGPRVIFLRPGVDSTALGQT